MKNSKIIIPAICVLVGLGAGFFGGFQYRNYQTNKFRGNFGAMGASGVAGTSGTFERFNGTRTAGQNGARMGGGAVSGSILSMDAKSLTVKLLDGSSKIVLFSDSTAYSNTIKASLSDLKVGSTVAVFGTANSDGSVTATNVQINPMTSRPQGSPNPAQ